MKIISKSKSKFYTLFLYIFFMLLLPSCATELWYQAESECIIVAEKYYPPNYQRMEVTKNYWTDVPDGYDCEKVYAKEKCHKHAKSLHKTYQAWKDVDVNTEARNRYIDFCTAEVCKQRYGNVECKVQK